MEILKRSLSVLLALVLVFGMLPISVTAGATETEPPAEETVTVTEEPTVPETTETAEETVPETTAAEETVLTVEPEAVNAAGNQLGVPTDLTWNILIDTNDVVWFNSPGWVIWKAAEPDEGHVQIKLYLQGQSAPVKVEEWYYDGSRDEFSAAGWRCANSLAAGDVELKSGSYYFTLQSISDSGNYEDSEIATSDTYTYVRPSASMGSCNNVHWDGMTAYWTTDGYIEEDNWYFVQCYYTYDGTGEPVLCGQAFPEGETYASLSDIIANWGQGYYTFRVRAQSNNIETHVHGDWSEMSETIYVNENGQISDPPAQTEPAGGMTQDELEAALAASGGEYHLKADVTLTRDLDLSAYTLYIESGAVLTVSQSAKVTVGGTGYAGLYVQPGGELIVNGELVNYSFVMNNYGLVQVNGTYTKGQDYALVQVAVGRDGPSEVSGIDKRQQMLLLYAQSVEDIHNAGSFPEYGSVQVSVSSLEINEAVTITGNMIVVCYPNSPDGSEVHETITFGENAEVTVNGQLIINSFNADMTQTVINNGTINVTSYGVLMVNGFLADDYSSDETQALINNGNIHVWSQLLLHCGSITNNGELVVNTDSYTYLDENARVLNNGQCYQGLNAGMDLQGTWEGNPINADTGESDHAPYLTAYWLWEDESGFYVNHEDGPYETYGHGSCATDFCLYFLNVWNEETGEYEATPVVPQCDNGDFSFTLMKDDPENYPIREGEEYADYFCVTHTYGDLWYRDSEIYVLHNGEKITLPFAIYGREIAFYSTPEAKPETLLEGHQNLKLGEENAFYVVQLQPGEVTVSNFSWNANTWGEDWNVMVSDGQLIDFEDLGNGVWKFTIDPEYVELSRQPGGIWLNFSLSFECDLTFSDGNTHHNYWELWIDPAQTTDPYLSVVWLEDYGDGEGWFVNPDYSEPQPLYGMGGTTRCYNLYFLNVWNEAKGEYEAQPIIPQGNGEDIFITPMTSMPEEHPIKDGEEYGDYFCVTEVGGNLYYNLSKISVNYNGETLTFPFEIYSRNIAFFSQPEAKPEYLLEGHQNLKYGEENAYYVVVLEPDYYTVENFNWYVNTWEEDYNQFVSDGQFIDFEELGNGVYKFTIDPEYVEYTRQPNANWIWKNFNLVFECDLKGPDGNDYGHWAQDIWVNPADASVADEQSLRAQIAEGLDYVALNGDIVLSADLNMPEIYLDINGGSITVPAGKTLTLGQEEVYDMRENVSTSIVNGGSIVVESGATLILNQFTYIGEGSSLIVKEGGKVIFNFNASCDFGGTLHVEGTADFGISPVTGNLSGILRSYNSGSLDDAVKGIPYERQLLMYFIYSAADFENAVKLEQSKPFFGFAYEICADVTLPCDVTVPEGGCLEAIEGNLIIPEGRTVTNYGSIYTYTIDVPHTITNQGTVENHGEIIQPGGEFRNDGIVNNYDDGTISVVDGGIFRNNGTVNAYPECTVTVDGGTWEGNEPVEVVPTSGKCGGTLEWSYDPATGTLTITGIGDMFDFIVSMLQRSADPVVPWAAYQADIKQVILPEGLTSIGSNAFNGCENLTKITIPASVVTIGSSAFQSSGLTEITFEGDAPEEIGENAFENVTATVNYPQDNATWTDDKMQNYGGSITWGSDDHGYAYGDANHDGRINAKDATLVLQKSVGTIREGQTFCELCADVTGDGKFNAKDSTMILRKSSGLLTTFPVEG